jgi:Restriction endonuclease
VGAYSTDQSMFDVFTEEIEVIIKDGMANLYWYKGDLHKAWLRSGADSELSREIALIRDDEGRTLSKRSQMDALYERLRDSDYNRRLEVSRNFVRILIEHKNFVPQDQKHRIEVAERASLKLRELIAQQSREHEYKERIRRRAERASRENYHSQLLAVRDRFIEIRTLEPSKRGYALEKIFVELMTASGVPVEAPFRLTGEQIDGAIKYDGHYYLIELKWTEAKADPKEIGHFYFKVEGKLDAKGIMISMNGFTEGVLDSLPKGKELRILLLDGNHLANVIFGQYTFQELLEHAISQASLKGELYCPHNIKS